MLNLWPIPIHQPLAVVALAAALLGSPAAHADGDNNTLIPNNKRLNDGVVANVYTVQHQAGCANDVTINPQLQRAAQRHTHDLMSDRNLDSDIGSDGSTPEQRAEAEGFRGHVSETVAINPALAISGMEVITKWYNDPDYYAIMSNCTNAQIGVWSENSLDRTVLVAVYGRPEQPPTVPAHPPNTTVLGEPPTGSPDIPIDPSPDYDASDELEFADNWFAWILRGRYPPPAYPPN